ncbi:response regulator [Criblamydia sequanensis]|uniref:Signal transduction response regulator n=1 Tax=Candidatus Criblamydia sequanensis CRIB-18 TaxID=1437425 RepID=A0A090D045_9BACT|nr:response regulator [Criblamydia sequanensis]CDR33170.1 Signal transduction response regulator [Criblamydia sequanensis CRIB-18]
MTEKKTILLAEDNYDNQELMKDIFETLQYEVDIANDGEEALEKWKNNKYDLIILDLHMPKKDGFQVSMEIRALEGQKSRIPIIALTASALASDRQKCLEFGMDDHISKPIDLDMLEKKLKKILHNK